MFRKTILIAAVAGASLGLAGVAGAEVANTFGAGGTAPTLNADCSHGKIFLAPADGTLKSLKAYTTGGFTITQTVLKCEHRRTSRLIACAKLAPAASSVPTVTVYHGDDWKAANIAAARKGIDTAGPDGIDALRASVVETDKALNCQAAVNGVQTR